MASVLAKAIQEFRSHRPELRFQLYDGDTASVTQKVETGALDMGLGVFFKHLPGIRRIALFRFSLMVIRADDGHPSRRATTTWSALKGEKLISLQPSLPMQQFVDRHLRQAGVVQQPSLVLNYLNTQIAMVDAGQGMAIIPSFGLPACRSRKLVMSRLVNPVVPLDFSQIRRGDRKLPPVAEDFTAFLQSYIASWAGRSGIL
jgi:DNA-binding transcriptional LysR family regulator